MDEEIKIHNVVASCTTNTKIPLSQLSLELEGTEYEPEQFPGLVYRIKEPKSAALVFNSGKIVCTGTKSSEQATSAINILLEDIRSIGIEIPHDSDITVHNMVASTKVAEELNLNKIAFTLEGTEYEPEQFPGLVLRFLDPKVVFLLFRSGKVICTGGKSSEMVHEAIGKLKIVLEKLNKDTNSLTSS
ncbi:MAG: TATA-box-binding protein [DPANN group archaeon]|nr:TATA-box-binding protein [DPANN group archaeon]